MAAANPFFHPLLLLPKSTPPTMASFFSLGDDPSKPKHPVIGRQGALSPQATKAPPPPPQSQGSDPDLPLFQHHKNSDEYISFSPPEADTYRNRLSSGSETSGASSSSFNDKLKHAAQVALASPNRFPWEKHEIHLIPAEKIRRHLYKPPADGGEGGGVWSYDETIVKMESTPFDKGAMRQCYRLKKLAQLPADATNHSFHKIDWQHASNYVAKSYITADGSIDSSVESKEACFSDIKLQYEAARWAETFNKLNPPKQIHIIRAYAIEFVDRPESPVMEVERFIAGTDEYGVGYTKHNTNSGFVDPDLKRVTPQTFSVHSFYASKGSRMVVDIQGVGDLYTDPQVHSEDLSCGDADLGVRGFALFFVTYEHSSLASALGIPVFRLSGEEVGRQRKAGEASTKKAEAEFADQAAAAAEEAGEGGAQKEATKAEPPRRRQSLIEASDLRKATRKATAGAHLTKLQSTLAEEEGEDDDDAAEEGGAARSRSASGADAHARALKVASTGAAFETVNRTKELDTRGIEHELITPDAATRASLGGVHLEISRLYGASRFVEENGGKICVPSMFFHLCHSVSLRNEEGCLALGRLLLGLKTNISEKLSSYCGEDGSVGKTILEIGAACDGLDSKSKKAAAACCCLLLKQFEAQLEADKILACCTKLGDYFGSAAGGGGDDDENSDAEFAMADYEVYALAAKTFAAKGDADNASSWWADAAEAAMGCGKMKLSMTYSMNAEA